jgi:hypothetical protein
MEERLRAFVEGECIPAEHTVFSFDGAGLEVLARLRDRARQLGFWNLWVDRHLVECVPPRLREAVLREVPERLLTLTEYARCAEVLGRCELASYACNW